MSGVSRVGGALNIQVKQPKKSVVGNSRKVK